MEKVKTTDEMSFQEYTRWAEEYALTGLLDNGVKGLKQAIWMIVEQTCHNKEFGGERKKKK